MMSKKQEEQLINDEIPFLMDNSQCYAFQSDNSLKFVKVNSQGWGNSSIKSCQSFKTGIHSLKLKIISSPNRHIMLGVCEINAPILTNYIGAVEKTWSYYSYNGSKYLKGTAIQFGPNAAIGDIIEAILDLTSHGTLAFKKNGTYMGIAFSGLKQYGDLCFAISSYDVNDTFEVQYEKIQ